MEQKDNLLGVLKTLVSYLRFVVTVCIIVGIGSIVISLLLPVYYKASTVFLSASPDLLTERGLFGTTTRDPQPFGNNNDNDRLLTIAESDELVNYLIDEFDLYQHYDIDSSSNKAAYYIKEQFKGLYEVQMTKRDAIQLSIEDEEPKLAAQIANAAREKINAINLRLAKDLQNTQISTFKKNIAEKTITLQSISDSLQAVRKRFGIYNIESQSETLSSLISSKRAKLSASKGRLNALSNSGNIRKDTIRANIQGLSREIESLEQQLLSLNEGMPQIMALEEEYDQAVKQVTYDKERLKQLQAAYNADVSSIILVEEASIPIIKSRPVRSILVVGSVIAAFIFGVLGALLYDTYKDLDWQSIIKK